MYGSKYALHAFHVRVPVQSTLNTVYKSVADITVPHVLVCCVADSSAWQAKESSCKYIHRQLHTSLLSVNILSFQYVAAAMIKKKVDKTVTVCKICLTRVLYV